MHWMNVFALPIVLVLLGVGCNHKVASKHFALGYCDDGNAATTDFYHPKLGCCHRETKDWDGAATGSCPGSPGCDPVQPGQFAQCKNGVEYDINTENAWSPWKNGTWNQHAGYCAGLTTSGISWKVPTVNEGRTLFESCAPVLPGGSCQLMDPACLSKSCGTCGSCVGGALSTGAVLGPSYRLYCKRGFSCVGGWTSSGCTDCPPPAKAWGFQFVNGALNALDKTQSTAMYCIASVGPGSDAGPPDAALLDLEHDTLAADGTTASDLLPADLGAAEATPTDTGAREASLDATPPDGVPPGADGGGTSDDGGCSCRVDGQAGRSTAPIALALLVLVFLRRRG